MNYRADGEWTFWARPPLLFSQGLGVLRAIVLGIITVRLVVREVDPLAQRLDHSDPSLTMELVIRLRMDLGRLTPAPCGSKEIITGLLDHLALSLRQGGTLVGHVARLPTEVAPKGESTVQSSAPDIRNRGGLEPGQNQWASGA